MERCTKKCSEKVWSSEFDEIRNSQLENLPEKIGDQDTVCSKTNSDDDLISQMEEKRWNHNIKVLKNN